MSAWSHISIFRFSLSLSKPIPVGHTLLTTREGLLVALEDEDGCVGLGEVVPLPGMHKETLAQAGQELSLLCEHLSQVPLDTELDTLLTSLDELYVRFQISPSVRFGIDMAALFYRSGREMQMLHSLLHPESLSRLPVQALLGGERGALLALAKERLDEGYTTFKVKVGRASLDDDIRTLHELRELLGPEAVLRLDPNQAWTLEQAVHFVENTRHIQWEFLEEPLRDSLQLPSLYDETDAAYALDESLGWGNSESFVQSDGKDPRLEKASALILKPHILGGWKPTQAWIKWALMHDKKVVFSDCFGTGLGIVFLAHWASSLRQCGAQGLDTWRWMEQDLVSPVIHSGWVEMESSYEVLAQIHPGLLEPVKVG
ncbi:MAG: o-succinylbenzoate synthase [Deltaproteobacteria bacterium]|nr:MAG: o-succinylbenzoate synthase [Deltaproteobacteria bacterium]